MSASEGASASEFWKNAERMGRVAGRSVMEPALRLYFAVRDPETPVWAKRAILGALAYLVLPLDAVPDFLPMLGFTDDLGVILGALTTVAAHLKPEHAQKARETLRQWMGEGESAG